jgi:gliding motility-associated-like protein
MLRSFIFGLGLLALVRPSFAQVVVNEVTASNWSHHADNFGQYEDYIELYNPTGAAVDLSGWYISDSQNNNLKYQFQAGTTIAANGYLMVYCSGRNTVAGGVIHTNFKLNQTQEERAVLSDPSGTIVDNFKLEQRTKTDHSWGRTTDGAGTWSLFTTPTPGAANVNASAYYADKPTFSQAPGFYGAGIVLELTAQGGTQIRYTLDGTTPNAGSTLYTGPIPINATTVVRAVAIPNDPTIPPSFVETNTYFINVSHTVSVVSIAGDQLPTLLGGTQIQPQGTLEFFDSNGTFKGETAGEFNEHGNDSWAYPQRGIDYIGRDDFGLNDGLYFKVFRTKNRENFQRLILKAGASDNYPFENGGAHIRDAFVQALSHESGLHLDERTYEPCVLYMNGQYWGVYEVREKVDDKDFTAHYYDQEENDLYYLKTWGATWAEYGGANATNDWNQLRNFIMTNNMGDPAAFANVDANLNWKSLVDYFCLNSYVVCRDWLNWNTGWWRGMNPLGDGRRWRYTLWDMDAVYGHYTNFTNIPNTGADADPCQVENLPNPGGQGHTEILEKLINENPMVAEYYTNRYIDLGNTVFHCDHTIAFLDSMVALIAPEMPGQIARWGGNMAQWETNVQRIRDFMLERCEAIQDGLIDCYDLEGPYDVVFNVDPPGAGMIRINSITPETYPFSGVYYGGINTTLAPLPNEGWVFSHWEVFSSNTIQPSLQDSLVAVNFQAPDSIVAHFVPPTRYDVVLDMVPKEAGTITFEGVTYTEFPQLVSAPEGVDVPFSVEPAMYHDFIGWTIKNNPYTPSDTTLLALTGQFWTTDTITAWLKPQDYVFYTPNSFTPNNDGINDVFLPINNVVDLENYDFSVYDRWGGIIFQTKDPYEGWDGTSGGQPVPMGVYVFRAEVMDAIKKDRYELFGHVTLFR